jgi:hypothetical protein
MTNNKANFWAKSCLRKKAMKLEHAQAVVERAKNMGNYLRPYLCHICCNYHVTKKKLKEETPEFVDDYGEWFDPTKKIPPEDKLVRVKLASGWSDRAIYKNGDWLSSGDSRGKVKVAIKYWSIIEGEVRK